MEKKEKTNITEGVKLIIPLATYRKIMAYTTLSDIEISGFAEVEYSEPRNAFIAGEVYLIKQNCTGTGTHMEEEDVSRFELERIKAGAKQLPRIWWHSHVNMGAFFSGIDEDTLKNRQNDTFAIALVVNKRKEMKAKMYIYNETVTKVMGFSFESKEQVEVDPLPIAIEWDYERIPEVLKKEVEEKVTAKVIVPQVYPKSIYRGRTNFNGPKTLQLPKDPEAAMKRIEELNLSREGSYTLNDWVYKDPNSGQIWIDFWESVGVIDRSSLQTKIEGEDEEYHYSPPTPEEEIEREVN